MPGETYTERRMPTTIAGVSDPNLTVEAAHYPTRSQAARRGHSSARASEEDVAEQDSRRRRRDAVGSDATLGPRHAGDRQPPRLADDRRAHARRARRAASCSPRRRATTGCEDVVLLGMGGSSLAPEVLRRSFGAAARDRPRAARARLDRRRQDPRGRAARSTRSERCSSSPRSPAARSSRCRCSRTSGRSSSEGKQLRRDHRPRLGPGSARRASTASGGRSPATRTSAGATARCPPSASCRRALMGIDVRALLGGSAARLGDRARARVGSGSGGSRRAAGGGVAGGGPERPRAGRTRQAHVRHLRDAARPRAVARAARRRVHGQARHGHPAGRRRAARRPGASMARTACSPTCRTSHAPDAELERQRAGARAGRATP